MLYFYFTSFPNLPNSPPTAGGKNRRRNKSSNKPCKNENKKKMEIWDETKGERPDHRI